MPTTADITDAQLSELVAAARDARPHSYSPYSSFRAGAAALTESGDVTTGVIVENVSLGLAMCSERVAMFSAVARGQRPVAVALVSPKTDGELTWPCGACLQTAAELGGTELVVAVASIADADAEPVEYSVARLGELLPRAPIVDHSKD